MPRTASPLITEDARQSLHGPLGDAVSAREYIAIRRELLGIATPAAFEQAIGPIPIEFGRSARLDYEPIQDAPQAREPRRPWRLAGIVVGGAATLIAAPWVIGVVLRWIGAL